MITGKVIAAIIFGSTAVAGPVSAGCGEETYDQSSSKSSSESPSARAQMGRESSEISESHSRQKEWYDTTQNPALGSSHTHVEPGFGKVGIGDTPASVNGVGRTNSPVSDIWSGR